MRADHDWERALILDRRQRERALKKIDKKRRARKQLEAAAPDLLAACEEVAKIQKEIRGLLADAGVLNSRISNVLSYLIPQVIAKATKE